VPFYGTPSLPVGDVKLFYHFIHPLVKHHFSTGLLFSRITNIVFNRSGNFSKDGAAQNDRLIIPGQVFRYLQSPPPHQDYCRPDDPNHASSYTCPGDYRTSRLILPTTSSITRSALVAISQSWVTMTRVVRFSFTISLIIEENLSAGTFYQNLHQGFFLPVLFPRQSVIHFTSELSTSNRPIPAAVFPSTASRLA
jgi:hypothetical protein